MNASDLNQLLNGACSGDTFKKNIQEEVLVYSGLMNEKGSVISLKFNEDEEIVVDNSALKLILQETLLGRLSNIDLAYICDCLSLGEKIDFKDEMAKDMIFEQLADPEINGGYRSDMELRKMLEVLKAVS